MESFRFSKALERVIETLYITNKYWDSRTPWKLAKSTSESDQTKLHNTLYVVFETIRVCGILLSPVMPIVMGRLLDGLAVEMGERAWVNARVGGRWSLLDTKTEDLSKSKIYLVKMEQLLHLHQQLLHQ